MVAIEPMPLDDTARNTLFPGNTGVIEKLTNTTAMVTTYVLEQDGRVVIVISLV